MKRKPIKPTLRRAYGLLQRLHLHSYENYQPVAGSGRVAPGTRDCEVRWEAIRTVLDQHHCRSLVDLGCSEGYYVLQAARHGLPFCVGVDFDLRRTFTSTSQVVLGDLAHAAFMISEVNLELLEALPRFDAAIFLSVLHHIMYQRGPDHCRRLLSALARRLDKVLIFEMGQSDEHMESWADKLPDMGANPHHWIADFLRSSGFSEVEKIAEAPSYKREVQRALFKAVP